MKYRKIKIISFITAFIAIGLLYASSHSTYYKYNDWWIIGKTAAEIEKRYGKFDSVHGNDLAYLIDGFYFEFDPDGMDEYYHIIFDDNGFASYVFVSVPYGG